MPTDARDGPDLTRRNLHSFDLVLLTSSGKIFDPFPGQPHFIQFNKTSDSVGTPATDAGVLKSSWPTYLPPLMDPKLRVTWTPSNGVSFSAVRLRNTFACSDFVQTGEHRK